MSESITNEDKKKCSDCTYYQKVTLSGNRQQFQCINTQVFKEDIGATNVGYINANIARRFPKYCATDGIDRKSVV